MKQHAFIVFNPAAGSSRERVRSRLENHFQREDWSFEVCETTGQKGERIVDVVRRALDEDDQTVDLVVAVGGDGTMSGTAAGTIGRDVPLGIIPMGTGNVLARELSIPLDIEGALDLLTGDHSLKKIDAMGVGDRYFVLNVSVGLSSLMMKNTRAEDKQQFGRLAYLWNGFKKWVGFQPHTFEIVMDDRTFYRRAAEVMIANNGAIGDPSLRWSPDVELDDGRIDVCVVRAKTIPDYIKIAWSVITGQQRREPHMENFIAEDHVIVNTDSDLPVQGDGDYIGRPPAVVQVVPGAVQIVVPQAGEDGLDPRDWFEFLDS